MLGQLKPQVTVNLLLSPGFLSYRFMGWSVRILLSSYLTTSNQNLLATMLSVAVFSCSWVETIQTAGNYFSPFWLQLDLPLKDSSSELGFQCDRRISFTKPRQKWWFESEPAV